MNKKIKALIVLGALSVPVNCTTSTTAKAVAYIGNMSPVPKWIGGLAIVGGLAYGTYKVYDKVSGNSYRREARRQFAEYEAKVDKTHKESYRGQLQDAFFSQPKIEKLGYIAKVKLYAGGVWVGLKRNSWRVAGGIGVVIGCYFGYQRWGLEPVYNLSAKILFKLVSLVSKAPVKQAVKDVSEVATKV